MKRKVCKIRLFPESLIHYSSENQSESDDSKSSSEDVPEEDEEDVHEDEG
jgi:hypothetical protein